MKVAFIGLGNMGFPMAGHLATGGHGVTVFNRTTAKAEAWVEKHGGTRADTPAGAADGAEMWNHKRSMRGPQRVALVLEVTPEGDVVWSLESHIPTDIPMLGFEGRATLYRAQRVARLPGAGGPIE